MLPSGFGQLHPGPPQGTIRASRRLVLTTALGSVVQWAGANSPCYEQGDENVPGIMEATDSQHMKLRPAFRDLNYGLTTLDIILNCV